MIDIKNKALCSGCNACGDICPSRAISFVTDEEGFWYPQVNASLCTGCGQCVSICPSLSEKETDNNNFQEPVCYSAQHKSIDVVFSSTSGGMFSALAEVMYNDGGYVGGAVHNGDFSVSHFISNDRKDLKALRRSKDLQSDASGFYIMVRELLDNNEKVLVCGLPCQIAGLKSFLGREYGNLITVDLICGGVNSPKVWRRYLDYIEEINGSKIIHTENKSKEYGWRKLTQKFVFENGDEYFDTASTSPFIKGFIGTYLYCRPSCYECRFKGFPRIADISIGDFWSIEKYTEHHDADLGTSVVLINNQKGAEYFEKAGRRLNYERADIKWALDGNPSLVKPIPSVSDKRAEFFADLDKMRFDELIGKYSSQEAYSGKKKSSLRTALWYARYVAITTRMHPSSLYKTIRYSGLSNLLKGRGIVCGTNCHLNIDRTAKLEFNGLFTFGRKDKFKKSKAESRLFVGKNARLTVNGEFAIDADNEIVIFDKAELIIHGKKLSFSDANSGLRIICGQKIEIMPDVGIGRNVTIRDTNGAEHFINTAGYRPSRPVVIGEKAWLCESCAIMQGVNVGRGAIVGAYAVVTKSVPDHAMVSGSPAEIVKQDVTFKL